MTPLHWPPLFSSLPAFADQLDSALEELEMKDVCISLPLDHICVRFNESATVSALQQELAAVGETISENVVNGRAIPIIQLHESLTIGPWQTFGVEVPYPKPTQSYKEGWEHVEFVLPATGHTLSELKECFFTTWPHLTPGTLTNQYRYQEDEPVATDDQLPNPTISIKVGEVGIKFHTQSIQAVVGYES